ncbi:OmpA family protein [Zavarzinia compransoris]|nr:OmpA family protein [Zavarzinia compransoris]TDP46899.1 outer membrane protein OmpA-like peptidoglycan-associated protein [Zavarzinia compransoris]
MLNPKHILKTGAALVPLCLMVSGGLVAQTSTDLRGVENPSQCEIYEAIGRALPPECATAPLTRGLGLEDEEPGGSPTPSTTPAPSGGPGVAVGEPSPQRPRPRPPAEGPAPQVKEGVFTLQFKLNSAELTAQARDVLDKVAVVMNDPASRGAKFIIKGFTDASGAAETNLALSRARAEAARSYLITVRGVPAPMVFAEGHGETGLLRGLPPNSPWHRRVEILADFRG